MINKVGIAENMDFDPRYNKRGFFELKTRLTTSNVNKISSVMCAPSSITLEKSKDGILINIDFKIKIIYSQKDTEALYVFETNTTTFLEIETLHTINGENIKFLLKSKSLQGAITIYDISCCILDETTLLLRVSYYGSLKYPNRLTIAFSAYQKNISYNLYLSDSKFNNVKQITYDINATFPIVIWSELYDKIYYVKNIENQLYLCKYNIKNGENTVINQNFTKISTMIFVKNCLYIHGELNNTLALYSMLDNGEISLIVNEDHLYGFSIADMGTQSNNTSVSNKENIFTLISSSNETLLKEVNFSLFGEDKLLKINGSSFLFSECRKYFSFLDKNQLYFVNLSDLKTFHCNLMNNISEIKFISEIYNGDIIIQGIYNNFNNETTQVNNDYNCNLSYIFLFSTYTKKIKILTKKPIEILSVTLINERTTLLVAIKIDLEINIISIDLKNNFKNEVVFSLKNSTDILFQKYSR